MFYLVLGNDGLVRLNHRLQLPDFLPQSSYQGVSIRVVDGHGVDDLFRPLNVPVAWCGVGWCGAVGRRLMGGRLDDTVRHGRIN